MGAQEGSTNTAGRIVPGGDPIGVIRGSDSGATRGSDPGVTRDGYVCGGDRGGDCGGALRFALLTYAMDN